MYFVTGNGNFLSSEIQPLRVYEARKETANTARLPRLNSLALISATGRR